MPNANAEPVGDISAAAPARARRRSLGCIRHQEGLARPRRPFAFCPTVQLITNATHPACCTRGLHEWSAAPGSAGIIAPDVIASSAIFSFLQDALFGFEPLVRLASPPHRACSCAVVVAVIVVVVAVVVAVLFEVVRRHII